MKTAEKRQPSPIEDLCLACGLCCNGVIFADVKLRTDDDAVGLRQLGLPLKPIPPRTRQPQQPDPTPGAAVRAWKFDQPCPAHDGCYCGIYANRPGYCREFECLLLKSVTERRTSRTEALRIIRSARQKADRVRHLLEKLGDSESHLPLSKRFRRTAKRLETGGLDELTAELYGELTLAVHDLNLLLSSAFFSGQN